MTKKQTTLTMTMTAGGAEVLQLEAPLLLPMLALVLEAASKQSSKWMEMVSNRSLASDLVESAALARVLPLLAADPKISPADVYTKTRVRTTQASLDDAAAHVLAATKAFDQLSGAGFDAVRSQQRQTMPKAPAASKVAATAAAPLSAPPHIRLCW